MTGDGARDDDPTGRLITRAVAVFDRMLIRAPVVTSYCHATRVYPFTRSMDPAAVVPDG